MFSTNLKHFEFCCRFGQNGFLALPNFNCRFLKSDDLYQKCVGPLFGTHPLVFISKLSFP